MKYKILVEIINPAKTITKTKDLTATFYYDPEQYGNKHFVSIRSQDSEWNYDIRYDTDFRSDNKAGWLENWAKNYWSGEQGAWSILHLEITKIVM